MYYIFRVERTEESFMRARAHQSIDLQNTCFHSVPQAALNSSDLREQPWKAFIKRMQNHQDIGGSTYSTTVCSGGVGEARHRAEQEVHARARRSPISESSLRFAALRHPIICVVRSPSPGAPSLRLWAYLTIVFSSMSMQGLEIYHSPLL